MDGVKNYTQFPLADPATLKPHPDNPNHHPAAQIDALCEVIRENGWRSPVVVSRQTGFVIKGHGRILAAQKLGCHVPVEYQDYPDEAAEARDLVADNKIAELSMLDQSRIRELQKRFKDSVRGWGDAHPDSGMLLDRLHGMQKPKDPPKAKFPILILRSQEQYDQFAALKAFWGARSDEAVFDKILARAFAEMEEAGNA